MQLVFADLPKPLAESCSDLKSLRVRKRYVSLPNMTVMGKNSSAKSTVIGWAINGKSKVSAGHQRCMEARSPESSEH